MIQQLSFPLRIPSAVTHRPDKSSLSSFCFLLLTFFFAEISDELCHVLIRGATPKLKPGDDEVAPGK